MAAVYDMEDLAADNPRPRRATRADVVRTMEGGRRAAADAKELYDAGRQAERAAIAARKVSAAARSKVPAAKGPKAATDARPKAAGTTGRGPARARTPHPARRRRRSPAYATAARQLRAPLQAQAVSGLRTVGLMLAVSALYLGLENADHVAGALGSVSRGLVWLRAPDRSVPYGPR